MFCGAQLASTGCYFWTWSIARTASATSFAGVLSRISRSYPWPQEKSWNAAVSVNVVASMGYELSRSRTFTVAL